MRDEDYVRKFFSKYATEPLVGETRSVARIALMSAFLISGVAFTVNLGFNGFGGTSMSGTSLLTVQHTLAEKMGGRPSKSDRHSDFSPQYGEGALCRADAQALARKYFYSNDQLKDSLAAQLAKTYKIAPKDAGKIVRTAAKTSKDHDIDPFLVLGIIAKESSFNTNAKSGYGAMGLMQVHAPSHKTVLKTMGLNTKNLKTTEKVLKSEIQINVAAGVQIYKQYEKQYGSRVKALQAYNGAKSDATSKYAKNVLALRDTFSAQAAAPIGCDKAGVAFVDGGKQKLALMQQKRNPA
jgi:soluble lytic murein transglycosylase-like protein